MTGLFSHRGHNQGRAFTVFRARQRKLDLAAFADCLANSGTNPNAIIHCALRLGKTAPWGKKALGDIRAQLGWQAR